MARTKPAYPPEFKAEAVRLAQSGEKPIAVIAHGRPQGSMDVADQTLRSWVQRAETDAGTRIGSLFRPRERRDPVAVFAFIEVEKANFPVAMMCRLLGVSKSGYYAWRPRPLSPRSRGTDGTPRIWAELRYEGVYCSRKRVARLLCLAGLQGCHRRKGPRTTRRNPEMKPAPDLVKRDFAAAAPDQLWVADITYVSTWMGFLYLAVVLDVPSRRVVGWAMAEHSRTELVVEAVEMAICPEGPRDGARRRESLTIRIRGASMPASPSGDGYARRACCRRWEAVATASITRWRRAFSPPSNANCLRNSAFRHETLPASPCSTTSRAFTTRTDGTRRWAISRPTAMNRS